MKRKKTKAKKLDSEKSQIDLIPHEAIDDLGKVYTYGLKKYGRINWQKGIEFSRLISATYRHLGKYNSGIDYDEETKTLHIANAMANLSMLIWMHYHRPDQDNRWNKQFLKAKTKPKKLRKRK